MARSTTPAAPSYRGTLGDLHIRAVVRTALRAHGFLPAIDDVRREAEAWQRCGKWLRDDVFPQVLPNAVAADAYRCLREVDPYVWQALPRVAAFGYKQAAALAPLVCSDTTPLPDVMILGAAFNTTIAFLDYLVDERERSDLVFATLDEGAVAALFGSDDVRNACLRERLHESPDVSIRVLLAFVAACIAHGRRLVTTSRNEQAWIVLGRYVTAAYAAQRLVSTSTPAAGDRETWCAAQTAKGTLLSNILMQISMLATDGAAEAPCHVQNLAARVGGWIARIDDLVDILGDCRAATATVPLLQVADLVAGSGRSDVSDADLYRALFRMCGNLVREMDSEGMLISRHNELHTVPVEARALAQFATTAVAVWCGYDEEEGTSIRASSWSVEPHLDSPEMRATEMILAHWKDDFREAIHFFPMPEAGGGGVSIHRAMLFQRATILDALIDAYDAGLAVPRTVLDTEASAILQAKHPYMRGGWSYIPEMLLLPPDADDLGIILQVLHRVGGRQLAAACDEPVRLAISATNSYGAVPTWIFGPRNLSPEEAPAIAYIDAIGQPGIGAQPEVVANFCIGLAVHDPVRYAAPLARGCAYVESAQRADGPWGSGWYSGDYYGTYRAVCLLDRVCPDSPALKRAREWLLAGQTGDGWWGRIGDSDPLSTAFAILALSRPSMVNGGAAVARGRTCLLDTQEADGGWPAVVWGAFATPYGFQTYGSRTITTAFVLKSLLATAR